MKRLLVPTDFSKCAANAVGFAVQTAKIFPAQIHLMHSYETSRSLYTDYVGANKEFDQTLLNEIDMRLNDIQKGIKKDHDITIDTEISTHPLQEAIRKSIVDKNIDLIVMGTQGASGIKEKIWGSRTSATISNAGIPVMAIPLDYEWKKPRKILLATNRFENDPAILNYIFELANLYMANIQVAVFTDKEGDKAVTLLDNERKLMHYGEFLKDTYNEKTITSAHLYGDQFESTLQNYIKENEIDILIMVTYGYGFWTRIFNPSRTKRMSYQTRIPLLAIPATNKNKSFTVG